MSRSESHLANDAQGAAILDWLNALEPAHLRKHSPVTIDSLANGHKIWAILQELDPQYFVGELPEPPSKSNKWLSSWQNLKYVAKPLAQFITERNGHLPSSMRQLDLKAIAMCDSDAKEDQIKAYLKADYNSARSADISLQLLKMVVFVTVNVTDNERYIQAMMELSPEQGKYLQDAIVEVGSPKSARKLAKGSQFENAGAEEAESHSTMNPAIPAAGPGSMDKDLYYEEQVGQMVAETSRLKSEKKNLQDDLRDLHDRIVRLQENNDVLQEKLTTSEDRLKQATASSNARALVRELEARVQRQDDLIAGQETQIGNLTTRSEALEAEANRLRKDAERLQPLQDQYDEIKVERDSLARKANAMEKYKQKLQAAADTEKEIKYLRNALDEARQLAHQGEEHGERVAELERAVGEYNRLLPNLENQLMDSESMRKRKDEQLDEMRRQLEAAQERSIKDQEIISELTNSSGDPFSDANATGALASELGAQGKLDKDMLVSPSPSPLSSAHTTHIADQERANDLEARNKRLNQTVEQGNFKAKLLQDMLDEQRKTNDSLLKSNRTMAERMVAMKAEIDGAKSPARPDRKKTTYVAVGRAGSPTDIPRSEEIETSLPSSSSPSSGVVIEHEATELARRLRYNEDLLARHREMVRKVMGIDDVGHAGPADEAKLSRVIDLLLSATNSGPDLQTLDENEDSSEEYIKRLAENVKRVRGILSDAKKRHATLSASFAVNRPPSSVGWEVSSTPGGTGAGSVNAPSTPVTPFPRPMDFPQIPHPPPSDGSSVKITSTSPLMRPSAPRPLSPLAAIPSPLTLSPVASSSSSDVPVLDLCARLSPHPIPSPPPSDIAAALPPAIPDFAISHTMTAGETYPNSHFLSLPPKASLPAPEPRRPSDSSSIKTLKATAKPVTRPISKFFSRMFSGSPKPSTANAKLSAQAHPPSSATSAPTPTMPLTVKTPTTPGPAPPPRAASLAGRPPQVRNSVKSPSRSPPSGARQWPGMLGR